MSRAAAFIRKFNYSIEGAPLKFGENEPRLQRVVENVVERREMGMFKPL